MICLKCGKQGEFYSYKGKLLRPCKACKKKWKEGYRDKDRVIMRRISHTDEFRTARRNYRKVEAKELRLQYVKKLLRRQGIRNPTKDLIELKKASIELQRTWKKIS